MTNLKFHLLKIFSLIHIQSFAISSMLNNIIIINCPSRHKKKIVIWMITFTQWANILLLVAIRMLNTKVWGYLGTNPRVNLLYNFVNIKKYKILSPPGLTYWPTSFRRKSDMLDNFVPKISRYLYYSVNNILDLNSENSSEY